MNNRYIKGFDEADKVLAELPQAVENKVLQRATRKAGNTFTKPLRAAAPRGSGKRSKSSQKYGPLFKNIKTQVLRIAKKKGQRGVRVTTTTSFWGYFIEFGTRFIPAQPWFRPVIFQKEKEAVTALKKELGVALDAETKKLANKYGVK